MTQRLKKLYDSKIVPEMKRDLHLKNVLQVPKLVKVTLNIGTSKAVGNPKMMEVMEHTMSRISGQKPVATKAKKSISAFKVREGQIVGLKATLRSKRMYDFMDKCISVALPRVRDFQGISPFAFDASGKSYTIGFREHIVFPEIKSDEIDKIHGLEVTFTTNAENKEQAFELLKRFGFPFRSEEQEHEFRENVKRMKEAKHQKERTRKRLALQAKAAQEITKKATATPPAASAPASGAKTS